MRNKDREQREKASEKSKSFLTKIIKLYNEKISKSFITKIK
jgi:hypothetical protein